MTDETFMKGKLKSISRRIEPHNEWMRFFRVGFFYLVAGLMPLALAGCTIGPCGVSWLWSGVEQPRAGTNVVWMAPEPIERILEAKANGLE